MEIGPVRRRFTAEPLGSPVPGEASPVHEPTAADRAPIVVPEPAEAERDVEAARPDPAR